uniref:Equilibrative nucleoside transporter 4 n=1 Tax=Auxenochlorella protothecoides TaxID=3075 RepID=A0A1D2AFS1_AUXPR
MAIPMLNMPNKIKGGRWTVARFFLVSTAYTSAWLAVSSQLDYFKDLYGPQILLQLNIAYYLPTVPLLLLSSLLDRHLDRKLGVARNILLRLLLGLVGYGLLAAWFPFQPTDLSVLIITVVALGLFSGLAFSASYQLVSRFANKNVIALGMGCTAAGPLVLALELCAGIGPHASHADMVLLYGAVALIVAAGAAAAASLVARHWAALDAGAGGEPAAGFTSAGAAPEGPRMPLLSPGGPLECGPRSGSGSALMHPLVSYSSLEPYRTYMSTDGEVVADDGSFHGALERAAPYDAWKADCAAHGGAGPGAWNPAAPPTPPAPAAAAWGPGSPAQQVGAGREVLHAIRLPLTAHFVSSTISLTVFPFFTYVPSSGLLGESFPRILFFARVFADIAGRLAPRSRFATPSSPRALLGVALFKLALVPIFFAYLKAPPAWRSDVGALLLVCVLWLLGGWSNTSVNLLAPRLVLPELKGTAAAYMAIAYQTAHFLGLAVAVCLALLLYGDTTGRRPH